MDNLTHTLTGLMLARAGGDRRVPRGGLLMILAANAPDVDVFWSWFGGTAHYLRHHRGWTHSLLYSPLIALLPVVIVWLVARKRLPWGWMWLLAWVGVLSHLAMDWTNIYGIRLLLPASAEWLRLDSVNIVDLFIWSLLLLGVLAPALGRLVSSEIGAKPGRGTGWAVTVLSLLAVYEVGRWVMHDRAVRTLESRIYEGASPVRVGAFALSANPFAWKGVVETAGGYMVFYFSLLEEFDPGAGRMYYRPPPGPAIEAAKRTNEFDALLGFSNWLMWRVTPLAEPEGASRVELVDLRFGTPGSPGLSAAALVDRGGGVQSSGVGFGQIQPR